MKFEEFESEIERETKADRFWNYAICSLSIIAGLFFLVKGFSPGGVPLFFAAFAFLVLFGLYGLSLLPKRYKIINLYSTRSADHKLNVIRKLIESFEGSSIQQKENYLFFKFQKKWWHSPFRCHIYFDENEYAFSLQGYDNYDGGFIDFGETNRKRRLIEEFLMSHSN